MSSAPGRKERKGQGPLGMKVYGWCPVELARHYSGGELHALERAILEDPATLNPADHGHPFTSYARRKLDAVMAARRRRAEQDRKRGGGTAR